MPRPSSALSVSSSAVVVAVVALVALVVAAAPVAHAAGAAKARAVIVPATRPAVVDPSPPTPGELVAFRNVVQDDDVLKIPPCKRIGLATTDCRDPMSYLTSNEALQHVWLPWIENLGGGFVGLGADQTYSFIAAARSQWAWLFDYDPQVVRVHKIVQTLIKEYEDADAFVSAFDRKSAPLTRERLKERLAGDLEVDAVVELFDRARGRLFTHYLSRRNSSSRLGWLNDPARYRYIRLLVVQGRIQALKGNMLTDKALPSIAASARALGVPVRVYYPSNAEEMWSFTSQYRANVASMPFDEQSVVLRTLFNKKGPWDDEHKYWHYVVHHGLDAQRAIADEQCKTTRMMMRTRRPTKEPIVSAIGFESDAID
jgi:hypothetical protein